MKPDFPQKLARLLAKHAREGTFSGAVLVRRGDTDLFRRACGYANRTWRVKNTPQTRFRIASVGKMFTAAAIMQLLEAGKLSLETPVVATLGLQGTKLPPQATVYHYLSMTSGIADWTNEESEHYAEEWAAFCREHPLYLFRRDADYLPVFAQLDPYGPLGEKHRYNGAGYMLLGLLIEKITGQGYFDYIRQNIFARAGMTNSDFLDLDDVIPNVAEGYLPVKDGNGQLTGWKKNIYAATAGPAADGGATSTLDDLARFARALRESRLCSAELAEAMLTPKVSTREHFRDRPWQYGLGCFILLDDADRIIHWGHTGEEDGVSCRLLYYPQPDLEVVILGNQSNCAGKLSWGIHDLICESKGKGDL